MSQANIDALPGRFVELDDPELPFQTEAIDFAYNVKRLLVELPTGTGKTYIALKTVHKMGAHKLLILCSGNALFTWQKNIRRHLPDLFKHTAIISKMSGPERKAIYDDPNIHVIVIRFKTYAYDYKLLGHRDFQVLIEDEAQKYMRNHKSKQYTEVIKPLCLRVKVIIELTAKLASKGRQEVWPSLHVFHPKRFPSYWAFVNKYIRMERGPFGVELGGPINTPQYREATKDCVFRPLNPITGLPQVLRSTIPIELEGNIRRIYDQFNEDMVMVLSNAETLIASNVLAKLAHLRQLLCCPAILNEAWGYGIGVETVLSLMEEEEDRRHCAWFTPYTAAIPHMKQALLQAGYSSVVTFSGGMELDDLALAETTFREDPNCVAINSIAYSQSYELETARCAFFIGFDWDPYVNMQGEGRCARLTTGKDHLNAYYLHHLNTVEDRLLEVCSNKVSNNKVDINSIQELRTLLHP